MTINPTLPSNVSQPKGAADLIERLGKYPGRRDGGKRQAAAHPGGAHRAQPLAVVIDPAPFLTESESQSSQIEDVVGRLAAGGVSIRVIGGEPDWELTLCAEDEST